ncbi:MAG: TIGR02206 family membrane protein [Candidatus Neomarinimicrobiota bacterium]
MSEVKEDVSRYLSSGEQFEAFGTYHSVSLITAVFLAIWLPLYAKRHLSGKWQYRIGAAMGWIVMVSYVSWPTLELIGGTFDPKLHLPFHLCRFANLTLPLVMVKRNYRMYEILYFWGLSAMIQASLTPDIVHGFPHYHFFRFWFSHSLMIVALIYATVVYQMRPTFRSLRRAFLALIGFLIVTVPVNIVLGSNYFWICGKPPVASLLDYMGPWPWYLMTAALFALGHFYLVYVPFHVIDRKS